MCDLRYSHLNLFSLGFDTSDAINKHNLENKLLEYILSSGSFPLAAPTVSNRKPSCACGSVPRDKSWQTAALQLGIGMLGVGLAAAQAGCRLSLMIGRSHPSLRFLDVICKYKRCVWLRNILKERLPQTMGDWKAEVQPDLE